MTLEQALISALGLIATAIAGWFFKSLVPRMLASYDERTKVNQATTDRIIAELDKVGEKIAANSKAVSDGMRSFEMAMVESRNLIINEQRDSRDKIIAAVHDRKIADLEDTITRTSRNPPEPKVPRKG